MLDPIQLTEFAEPLEGSVRMSDGRRLSYAEYGDRQGSPGFHFHGHPGSRLEAGILHETATALGVRLIGVDRPGMGHSDPKPRRRIIDWPSDIADIRHPNLHVWHGGLDRNVSISTARALAAAIPGAHPHFYDDEGHISIAMNHAADTLDVALVRRSESRRKEPQSGSRVASMR